MVRAAALILQKRRSLEHRRRLAKLLEGAIPAHSKADLEAAFSRVFDRLQLRSARAEHLWRGMAIEVVFDLKEHNNSLLLSIRQEDLSSKDKEENFDKVAATTVLALEHSPTEKKKAPRKGAPISYAKLR